MPMTPGELMKHHLEQAQMYARPLTAETKLQGDPVIHEETQLVAAQGEAMRQTIFHCTAALVAALERRR